MKNKQGFTISTLLYGLLAVIIIVLFALLAVLGSVKSANKAINDTIALNLNKCSRKLILLQNCISNRGSQQACPVEESQYNTCYGGDIFTDGEGYSIQLLKTKLINNYTLLEIKDPSLIEGIIYTFNNLSANNYVRYNDYLGRMIYITKNNNIKVLFLDKRLVSKSIYSKLEAGKNTSNKSVYESSLVINYLDKNITPLFNTNKLSNNHRIGIGGIIDQSTDLFKLNEEKYDLNHSIYSRIYGSSKGSRSKNTSSGKYFNILNLSDILLTTNQKCIMDNTNILSCIEQSWIYQLPEEGWTSTLYSSDISKTTLYSTKKQKHKNNDLLVIYPVTFIKSNARIVGGDGTYSNPYILS